jgi:DNA-binding transcriptional LysR family regulator
MLTDAPLQLLRVQLEQRFDREHGGFGPAPKFPHAGMIDWLLRRWHATASETAPDLQALSTQPLISYESSTRGSSSLQRAFAASGLTPDIALTALDADLIKTYVRTGLGVGLLAEMAVNAGDEDLRSWPAPAPIDECIAWAVLPRDRVLRDYALELVHVLAPQVDRRDLRRVLDGNQVADWPEPPTWESLTQTITS